ncbi:DUF792 family protein [Borrelia crocidurae]|nr:DUF792 family protein [Borrelia crocidurae]
MNQVFSLAPNSSFMVLFPRLDLRGFGYVPQIFYIHPKHDVLISSISANTTDKAVINQYDRKSTYTSYNVISEPQTLSINRAILTSMAKIMVEPLKKTVFGNTVLEFDSNLAKAQLKERVSSGVYFNIYSPSIGFHETAVITSLITNDSPYIDEVEVSLTIKILKTFNIASSSYMGINFDSIKR